LKQTSGTMEDFRDKNYFSQRATLEMAQHLRPKHRTLKETLAQACRIIALHEGEAGLAGQISARSDRGKGYYWTLRFGLGFDEATPDDFIEVDQDLHTVSGIGMANPATRFHLWVYESRPDVNSIVHTHSPCVSALAAAKQPLVVCQMDMTPFYENCAFLPEWPGLPIADHEGVIISEALGSKKSIILVNHGQLTTGVNVEEATYLSVYLERAASLQLRASTLGPLSPVPGELAKDARDYLLKGRVVSATFDYWGRMSDRVIGNWKSQ
jgi:L-fuculose-phosphate aldolase